MPKFIIGVVILTVIAIGAPFIIPGPNGDPLMDMDRVKRSISSGWDFIRQAKQLSHTAKKKAKKMGETIRQSVKSKKVERFDAPIPSPEETLFKWRDQSGNWHFTNQLPPEETDYEIVESEGTTE